MINTGKVTPDPKTLQQKTGQAFEPSSTCRALATCIYEQVLAQTKHKSMVILDRESITNSLVQLKIEGTPQFYSGCQIKVQDNMRKEFNLKFKVAAQGASCKVLQSFQKRTDNTGFVISPENGPCLYLRGYDSERKQLLGEGDDEVFIDLDPKVMLSKVDVDIVALMKESSNSKQEPLKSRNQYYAESCFPIYTCHNAKIPGFYPDRKQLQHFALHELAERTLSCVMFKREFGFSLLTMIFGQVRSPPEKVYQEEPNEGILIKGDIKSITFGIHQFGEGSAELCSLLIQGEKGKLAEIQDPLLKPDKSPQLTLSPGQGIVSARIDVEGNYPVLISLLMCNF